VLAVGKAAAQPNSAKEIKTIRALPAAGALAAAAVTGDDMSEEHQAADTGAACGAAGRRACATGSDRATNWRSPLRRARIRRLVGWRLRLINGAPDAEERRAADAGEQ
jgi:hypothetical protein